MSMQLYSPTLKERINPEFEGIASKFSQTKHKRLSVEKQRDLCLRALKYKMSVDLGLSKNIEEQRQKLNNVRSVHQRKLADEDFKRQQQQIKKQKLRSLTSNIKERREDLRRSIKHSKLQALHKNRKNRLNQKRFHNTVESKLRENEQAAQLIKEKRVKSIKYGEQEGQNTVNRFFRTLNKESLNSYKSQIQGQTEKTNNYAEQIEFMKKQIDKYDKSIEKKKNKMFGIFNQIEGFTSETALEQSKCLPLYLRPNASITSHSSRPRDLLLKGPRDTFDSLGFKSAF